MVIKVVLCRFSYIVASTTIIYSIINNSLAAVDGRKLYVYLSSSLYSGYGKLFTRIFIRKDEKLLSFVIKSQSRSYRNPMESSELYHTKQLFVLGKHCRRPHGVYCVFICFEGAYKAVADLTLPDPSSPDYTPTLLYKARSNIALNNPKDALALIPSESEEVALKAVAALARYVGSTDSSEAEAALEELRDLSVEIEGDDVEVTEREKGLVRVLAGTAFARAKEIEEALETLGAGSDSTRNLEAYVCFKFCSIGTYLTR
jgi:Coatomer epsilon subunit